MSKLISKYPGVTLGLLIGFTCTGESLVELFFKLLGV